METLKTFNSQCKAVWIVVRSDNWVLFAFVDDGHVLRRVFCKHYICKQFSVVKDVETITLKNYEKMWIFADEKIVLVRVILKLPSKNCELSNKIGF